jgi:hypothetical protein
MVGGLVMRQVWWTYVIALKILPRHGTWNVEPDAKLLHC